MTRHCTRCNAEVEDAGGYCLLGHPLRLNMETSSLDELKREVEAAFESAQDEVRDTLTPLLEQVEATTVPSQAADTASSPAQGSEDQVRGSVGGHGGRKAARPERPDQRLRTASAYGLGAAAKRSQGPRVAPAPSLQRLARRRTGVSRYTGSFPNDPYPR
jgi:hypothetical protein